MAPLSRSIKLTAFIIIFIISPHEKKFFHNSSFSLPTLRYFVSLLEFQTAPAQDPIFYLAKVVLEFKKSGSGRLSTPPFPAEFLLNDSCSELYFFSAHFILYIYFFSSNFRIASLLCIIMSYFSFCFLWKIWNSREVRRKECVDRHVMQEWRFWKKQCVLAFFSFSREKAMADFKA